MIGRFCLTVSIILLAVLALSPGSVIAAAPAHISGLALTEAPPATKAGDIRQQLFDAQMAADPDLAGANLDQAEELYSGEFAEAIRTAAPEYDERILAGFSSARAALLDGQAPAFAAARSEIWTAILGGSIQVVENAVEQGRSETAQKWLAVREFRTTTRFSRPNANATLALIAYAKKETNQADTLLALHADLYDTYQARLTETLHDLAGADENGFAIRKAELSALAAGYFSILAPAYRLQRGGPAAAEAQTAFDNLTVSALRNEDLASSLVQIDETLHNFRAAPLTPEEMARRAGQVLRYLSLVPVEYGRGVSGSQVIRDFEIQEAISFHAGALAAFSDLENLMDERDPAGTARSKELLMTLGDQLEQAGQNTEIAAVDAIEYQVDTLTHELQTIMPQEWLQGGSQGDFDVIASMLDQMEAAVAASDYAAAESARLEAYAVMEVGPEARLMAFAPQLKLELEDLFWNGQGQSKGLAYLIKNQASPALIRTTRAQLDDSLAVAQVTLGTSTAPAAVAANAGMIMFREGLEAVIILASLMSSMKRAEERKYRKPMWLGTAAAILATVLTWMLAHDVLQSLARYGEKLEAVVSLIAIAVLLVIMNWFFHKLYWTEWIAGFHARKRKLLTGEAGLWLGLITLGFTSVYREGFESVLFLQALVLDSSLTVVLSGVGVALLAVVLVGIATFRLQVNLPYKKMLIVTGVLIGVVLLQMVGTTTHVLQVVGWLPIHVIGELQLPFWLGTWFGIYPTWEGLCLQVLAGAFVIGSYYLAEHMKNNRIHKGSNPVRKEARGY